MSTKRKRTHQVEVIKDTTPVARALPTSRTINVNRMATGRVGVQTNTSDVKISEEDLASLQENPAFSLPTNDILDFETSIQASLDAEHPEIPVSANKTKIRVSAS